MREFNKTWEAGEFTIALDVIVDESAAGKAQAYEAENVYAPLFGICM